MRVAVFPGLLLTIVLAGCAGEVTSPDRVGTAASFSTATADVSGLNAQQVAKAFAAAMANESVRWGVRDALRASPVTEHKVVLQDFIKTPAGSALLAAAARASASDVSLLRSAVRSLPDLDFYVPAREHRLGWKGDANLLVAATTTKQAPTLGYSPGGESRALALSKGAPREALFVLQPAERKSTRLRLQARRQGATIQDSDDGEVSGSFVLTDQQGRSTILPLSDFVEIAAIDCGRKCPPPPPPPPPDTTFLQNFSVGEVCDNGSCSEGNEFEFRVKYFLATGTLNQTGVIRFEGIRPFSSNFVNRPLIFRRIRENSTEKMTVEVVETDGLLGGGDDLFGIRTLTYTSNGQIQTYFQGVSQIAVQAVYRWVKKF